MNRPGVTVPLTPKNCFVKLYLMPEDPVSPDLEFLGRFRAVPEYHFTFARLYTQNRYMDRLWHNLTKELDLKPGRKFLMVAEFNKAKMYLT